MMGQRLLGMELVQGRYTSEISGCLGTEDRFEKRGGLKGVENDISKFMMTK